MTFEEIRQAITRRMAEWDGLPADCIDYPNSADVFDPVGKELWARLNNVPAVSSVSEVGADACKRRSGNVVVQLFAPLHAGVRKLTEAASSIAEHFELYSMGHLSFLLADMHDLGPDETGYYQINVTIGYRTM
ncbi:phage tail terminator-like protein [Carnimonas bestiolae]|uniref:phage tail terminator-like protein n=1 Tax=Carnimonas bestiolae TaxID=3402172 RepID=UPI003EDC96F6